MKAVFVHDHIFNVLENGDIMSKTFPAAAWERYTEPLDSLTVVARSRPLDAASPEVSGLSLSNAPKVSFRLVKDRGFSPAALKKDVKLIKEQLCDADALIVRLPSILGYIACGQAKKRGLSYAVEVVACAFDSNYYHGKMINRLMAAPSRVFMRRSVKKAGHALYVTDEFLQKRYPSKGAPAVASNVMVEIPGEEILTERLKRAEGNCAPVRFGLIGPLSVNFKGHATAIKALSRIKDDISPFELRCAGSGDAARWIKMCEKYGVRDNVFFDGHLKGGKKVLEWMDGLDMLLVPSLQEGLPRALIEAMSRGLPAVGSVAGGIPQLLNKEHLHGKNDYKALGDIIRRVVNSKEEMQKASAENYKKTARFDSEILKEIRADFFKQYYSRLD